MSSIRVIRRIASAVFALASIGSAIMWDRRRDLPFNSEGRYFDAASGTVVDQQSVLAFAALAITFALLAFASWPMARET
ncbi:hypothetical protein [Altererythrobacter sp. GH1-8]|uniref:hypothetical protein n=1 Tax=Altererythrobacter sp. GH1-8 TaxID=3349333 RepID=UPI00374CF830